MKNTIFILQFLFIAGVAFSQEGKSELDDLPSYPLKQIKQYCQRDTLLQVYESLFYYDESKKLIKSVSYSDSSKKYVREFFYNGKDLISEIYSYQIILGERSEEVTVLLTYDNNGDLISEANYAKLDEPGLVNNYNSKRQLITRNIYGGYWKMEMIFEYNKEGRLIEKHLGKQRIYTYEYSNGVLVKEIHHTQAYDAASTIIYEYTGGLLKEKKENGKTIERYVYKDGKLFKKWENYYGIDPCFNIPCCSQTLDVYSYY